MKMDVWEPFQLYLVIVLVRLPVSTRSDIVENTWRRDTLRKYHLIWPFRKIKSRKGANVQTTVSWMSQPVAQSGFPSICSNPSKDEGPPITWTGLTVRASCSGSSSGEQKSEAELVIQQKRLMIMDGVCSLWLNPPFACRLLLSLLSSSVHLFSSLFLCFMYSSSECPIPSRLPARLK